MRNLSCKLCGATLTADQLDRRLAIITCNHCGGIYDLTKQRGSEQRGESGRLDGNQVQILNERAPAPLPEKFRIEKSVGKFSISWRWFEYSGLFLLFFSIAWNSFIFNWIANLRGFDLFITGHVAVGIATAYGALANLLNTTRINVDGKTLKIKHYPLPWFPAPRLKVGEIEQIYVVEKYSDDKAGNRTFHYNVNAVMRDNSNRKLLTKLTSVEQGLYLEQEFETFMGIRDRPVAGEVSSKSFRN
jgi:hypothetical protein